MTGTHIKHTKTKKLVNLAFNMKKNVENMMQRQKLINIKII